MANPRQARLQPDQARPRSVMQYRVRRRPDFCSSKKAAVQTAALVLASLP